MKNTTIIPALIYTDGSCHTQYSVGAWVAIVLVGEEKEVIGDLPIGEEMGVIGREDLPIEEEIGESEGLLIGDKGKHLLSGIERDTTHNRMELTAVIKALEYLHENHKDITTLTICSDSQYVIGLAGREARLASREFTTRKGKELPNADLVKKLLIYFRSFRIEFVKIKAHQRKNNATNYNIEADLLSRKLVREMVHSIGERY